MKNLTDLLKNNVLIEYKRNSKQQLRGVVVAIGPDLIGWSLCDKYDVFDKTFGVNAAILRALACASLDKHGQRKYYKECPNSLEDIFKSIKDRSLLYFKD